MITKIASITYKTLDSLKSVINKFPTYLKRVIYIWLHVKCFWISSFTIKFFIKLTEKELFSLIYLKILLSLT